MAVGGFVVPHRDDPELPASLGRPDLANRHVGDGSLSLEVSVSVVYNDQNSGQVRPLAIC